MIIKICLDGDSAHLSTHPREKPGVDFAVPASRVRPRFLPGESVAFFQASIATTKKHGTIEDISLDVLELGDRTNPPGDVW